MDYEIGERFQQESKHCRETLSDWTTDIDTKPDLYKEYATPVISLPTDLDYSRLSLDTALKLRRSIRRYAAAPVSLEQLSYIVWSASGVQRVEQGFTYRTAPSAGGLYPVETYIIVNNVTGVPKGLYHYRVKEHVLETLKPGEYGDDLAEAAMGQSICANSAFVFIWTSIFQRSRWKYGDRAYRYVYLDAGHMAENAALTAAAMGLGSCPVAAIFDDEVNEIIGIDGTEESAIYMTTVGVPLVM